MVKIKSKNTSKSWKTVKIDGPVISDEGGNLEGLVGLEILEDYDKAFVKREKKKKETLDDIDDIIEPSKSITKKCKRKRKKSCDSSSESEDSGVDFQSPTSTAKVSNKKAKVVEIIKEQPKESDSDELPDSLDEDTDNECQGGKFVRLQSEPEAPPKKKKKSKKKKNKNKQETLNKPVAAPLKKVDPDEYRTSAWHSLGVPDEIIRSLLEQNFTTPTQIQLETIPSAIVTKRDILGAAETGSGKTLAFGIPVLNGIMEAKRRAAPITNDEVSESAQNNGNDRDLTPPPEELDFYPAMDSDEENEMDELDKEEVNAAETDAVNVENMSKPLYALILTPTRELAVQIHNHLTTAAKYTGINIAAIFGGLAQIKQERVLKKCPEIVIATPGRLWELIQSGNSHLKKVDHIKYLVVDETDRMVEKGHFDELQKLLDRLNMFPENKAKRQNFIFSATLTMVHDLPDYVLAKKRGGVPNKNTNIQKITPAQKIDSLIKTLGASNPKVIDITKNNNGTAALLTECRILCRQDHKDFYLYFFLQRHPGRTMVFCNSIESVKRLSSLFNFLSSHVMTLHGNMEQKQRLRNLEKFRDNPLSVMIATDVAARGLDIPNVQHVIHYQVPRTSENYVHRSGRTARANTEGIAILLIDPKEVKDYVKLNNTLGRTKDLPLFPVSDTHLKAVKERVILARELELLDLNLRRTSERVGQKKKIKKDAELSSDGQSDIDSEEEDHRKMQLGNERRKFKARKQQLAKLLTQPLFPLSISAMKFPSSTGLQPTINTVNHTAITEVKNAIEQNKQIRKQLQKKKQ